MFGRVVFILVTAFWITMNVLLWRSEFGSGKKVGSAVPIATVWQKILTAPDDSSLEIWRHGQRIGRCRWVANVGDETATGKVTPNEFEPEGQVSQPTGYSIDFEGTFAVAELDNRLRLNFHAEFSTNHHWREFTLRGGVKPALWEMHSLEIGRAHV